MEERGFQDHKPPCMNLRVSSAPPLTLSASSSLQHPSNNSLPPAPFHVRSPRSLLLLLTTCSRYLLHQLKTRLQRKIIERNNIRPTSHGLLRRQSKACDVQGTRRNSSLPKSSPTRRRLIPWFFALMLIVAMPVTAAEQKFAMQPMDQTAIVNSRVTLPCRVIGRVGTPQWTKDDFALGTDRNLSGFERYAMIGSDEEGDYSLEIYPVRLDDDARYQCQVAAGPKGQPGIRSRFATLTVLVPPEPPRILPQPGEVVTPAGGTDSGHGGNGPYTSTNPMSLLTTEDREIQLECVSKGGKPAAEITWIDGLGNVLKDGVEYMTEFLPDKKRLTAKSILRLTPRREHHKQIFTCQAQNAADRTYRSAKVRLLVNYAPKVTVSVSATPTHRGVEEEEEEGGVGGGVYALAGGPAAGVALGSSTAMASSSSHGTSVTSVNSGAIIREFDEVKLTCKADANPDTDLVYRWFINDEPVTGGVLSGSGTPSSTGGMGDLGSDGGATVAVAVDPTVLVIANVSRNYHDAIVKCEVHNAVGKSEESETLDISYGPRFRIRPQSVEAEEGSTVFMSCDVDGNPPADILWVHEPTDKVVGTSPNLTLHAGPDTAGRYRCTARVPTPHGHPIPIPPQRPGQQHIPLPPQEFPVATAWAWLRLRGAPSIVSRRVQFGVRGDTVRLECVALSVPRPERVVWTRAGRDVDANDRDFSVLEDPLPEGIKSTLIIRDSQDHHFGSYNCSVTNPYGSDGLEIVLKKQKTFPLLLIICGVIGVIVVIVFIALLVILCQRKGKKTEDEEKQTKVAGAVIHGQGVQPPHHHMHPVVHTHQSDRSSNDSDLKVEIRTASSLSNTLNERDSTGPWCEDDEDDDEEDGGVRISAVDDVDANEVVTKTGIVPGGPVVLGPRISLLTAGGELGYRYSATGGGSVAPDYPEPTFPPKPDGTNNNGYVPYVDYARDYNPPPPPPTIHDALRVKSTIPPPPPSYGATVDPRYNATYGNPYLRTPPPPPPLSSGGSSGSLPPPPTQGHVLNLSDPPTAAAVSPVTPSYTPPTNSNYATGLVSSTSSYGVAGPQAGGPVPLSTTGNPPSYGTLKAGTTPPPPAPSSSSASSSPSGTLTYAAGKNSENVRNGAVPQVARLPTSPTRHYIVPSHHQQPGVVKRGTLATHV